MSFTFEVTHINRLTNAHVVVLDGKVIEGSVTTDSTVELVHGSQHYPVRVRGVVLGFANPGNTDLSVTIDLREEAMSIVAVGDRLVSCNK
jgi:hypothetical protein